LATIEVIRTSAEHRQGADRRAFGWRTVAYGFLRSRRRTARRTTEFQLVYSDWHHPWLFFLAVGTMLLNSIDAFFTLQLLDRGFYEANPFMSTIMGHGTLTFAIAKMMLTAFGIFTLVYLSRHRFLNRFPTGLILTTVFSFYACLVCYEFVWLIRDL
jgi:Domain of unknown function (DUF5658)